MSILERAEAAATDPWLIAKRRELAELTAAHEQATDGVYKDAVYRGLILTRCKYEDALRELVKGSLV
jgi:hypothetical protein